MSGAVNKKRRKHRWINSGLLQKLEQAWKGPHWAALREQPRQVRSSRENKPTICLGSFSDVKSPDPVSLALLQTQLVLGTLPLSCLPRSWQQCSSYAQFLRPKYFQNSKIVTSRISSLFYRLENDTQKSWEMSQQLKGKQEFPISDLETELRSLPLSCFSMAGTGIEDRRRKQTIARFLNYAARPARSLCKIQILSNKCWSKWHKKTPACIFKLLE